MKASDIYGKIVKLKKNIGGVDYRIKLGSIFFVKSIKYIREGLHEVFFDFTFFEKHNENFYTNYSDKIDEKKVYEEKEINLYLTDEEINRLFEIIGHMLPNGTKMTITTKG